MKKNVTQSHYGIIMPCFNGYLLSFLEKKNLRGKNSRWHGVEPSLKASSIAKKKAIVASKYCYRRMPTTGCFKDELWASC